MREWRSQSGVNRSRFDVAAGATIGRICRSPHRGGRIRRAPCLRSGNERQFRFRKLRGIAIGDCLCLLNRKYGAYGCAVQGRAVVSWFELLRGFWESAVDEDLQAVF